MGPCASLCGSKKEAWLDPRNLEKHDRRSARMAQTYTVTSLIEPRSSMGRDTQLERGTWNSISWSPIDGSEILQKPPATRVWRFLGLASPRLKMDDYTG